jgi:hypothetical protein
VAKPIDPPRAPRRGAAQEFKSQLALELALNAFAIGGAAIIIRCLLLSLEVDERLWIGASIIQRTDILLRPFSFLPGADYQIVGNLSLADATLLAGVLLVPIGILARPIRRRQPI